MTIEDDDVRLLPGDGERCFPANPAHARKVIPEEVLAEAQNLFENTDVPAAEIARRVGLHPSLLYRTVLRKGWSRPDPKAMRTTVAKRVRARIEKELNAVELSLAQVRSGEARAAAQESAAILASLTRSLRELQLYDLAEAKAAPPPTAHVAPPPGESPEDLDEMRNKLARRLLALRDEAREREWREESESPAAAI